MCAFAVILCYTDKPYLHIYIYKRLQYFGIKGDTSNGQKSTATKQSDAKLSVLPTQMRDRRQALCNNKTFHGRQKFKDNHDGYGRSYGKQRNASLAFKVLF